MVRLNDFKLARMKAGLRQIDLAKALGVSESLVAKWETDRSKPTPEMSQRIEKILKIDDVLHDGNSLRVAL